MALSAVADWFFARFDNRYASALKLSTEINALASPIAIKSVDNARSYVDKLAKQWKLRGLSYRRIKARLAKAELAAIVEPSFRISEDSVAEHFNRVMVEMGAPSSMQVTGDEVGNFRRNYSRLPSAPFTYRNMFARNQDETIASACRPVEALFLIFLLQYGLNIEAARAPLLPPTLEGSAHWTVQPSVLISSSREAEYNLALDKFLQLHSKSEFAALIEQLVDDMLASANSTKTFTRTPLGDRPNC